MSQATAPADSPPVKTFADLGVHADICGALTDAGIIHPFPIQEIALPLALSGADLIGQARTGTGKTLAFGIPLLQRLQPGSENTQALVIVPTRELCLQVRNDLAQAGSTSRLRVVAAYGGRPIEPQAEAIAGGAPVVVGTPGRLLDLQRRRTLDLSTVTTLVLDEADEMLDLGFLPDVEQLIEATSAHRQTLLFSATMPSPVVSLARRYMRKPTFLRADVEEPRIGPKTRQYFFSCHRMDKAAVLARVLQSRQVGLCLVFTRTKRMADILGEELRGRGISAAPIHSDLRQDARERALSRFRNGQVDVLVATEVAARGLDIDDVTHVVNYDCPDDEKMYLHRIGRTGRAGAAGVAVTFAVWNELARLEMIKKALDIDEPTHEVFSTSPILDDLFDLPERPERRLAAPTPTDRGGGGRGGDAERAPAGGRSRRGRGRRRRRSAAGGSAETPPSSPVDAGGPVADGTGDDQGELVAAEPPAPVAAESHAQAHAAGAPATGSADDSVRRVRVRRRSGHGTAPATAGAASTAGSGAGAAGTGAGTAETPAVEQAGATAEPAGSTGDADSARPGRRQRRPTGRSPSRGAKRSGRRGGGGRRDGQSGQPDASIARAGGKPALQRPLVIAHLP